MKKYYYVYNRAQGKPIKRHETLDSAIQEAVRLSKLHEKNFYVLQPTAHIVFDHDAKVCVLDMEKSFDEEQSTRTTNL